MAEVFFQGEYEPLFGYIRSDASTVVDLGANCGFSAALWLDRFPSAKVIAVEPDESNVKVLKANNLDAMNSGRLVVVQACVGGIDRESYLERWRMGILRFGHPLLAHRSNRRPKFEEHPRRSEHQWHH
jgi:FkbM family methyltransferase